MYVVNVYVTRSEKRKCVTAKEHEGYSNIL
jgi:hypothetical protein